MVLLLVAVASAVPRCVLECPDECPPRPVPQCTVPFCAIQCEMINSTTADCVAKCKDPDCRVVCDEEYSDDIMPRCETVCEPVQCVVECSAPVCSPLCETPICGWVDQIPKSCCDVVCL